MNCPLDRCPVCSHYFKQWDNFLECETCSIFWTPVATVQTGLYSWNVEHWWNLGGTLIGPKTEDLIRSIKLRSFI